MCIVGVTILLLFSGFRTGIPRIKGPHETRRRCSRNDTLMCRTRRAIEIIIMRIEPMFITTAPT